MVEFNQGYREDDPDRPFITVMWQSSNGLPVDVERDGQVVETGDTNGFFADEASFAIGQSVTYRVRSVSGSQTSAWSAPLTVVFTTPPPPPQPPPGLVEFNQGYRGDDPNRPFITIMWQESIGIAVDVERDGQVVAAADMNGFFADEASFAIGQSVTYRVRRVVNGQTSVWSAPLTVVFTAPPPP